MIIKLSMESIQPVSGGVDISASVGSFFGWVAGEYHEHPIGAIFGPGGVFIAHQLTK